MNNVLACQSGLRVSEFSRAVLIALAVALFSPVAGAETLYVTDILRLGIYPTPDTTQDPIRVLVSGDALEVLERTGSYARVRTEVGDEGWVKTSYLVEAIPSKTRLAELSVATEQLRAEVVSLKASLTERETDLDSVRTERDQLQLDATDAQLEAEQQRTRAAALKQQIDNAGVTVPLHWLAVALIVTLVGGFAGGWWWTDARQRARHGGYRI
ncbi:MAG: TIGR04211 family SH3 domain-containing protein [Gammaproteobacteria bacterium]|nr:TIGR04211 family SH3 domain-containing protein [Gammaproteobacteria bacterium]